ncbi:MAG: inositol monophosphatase family protein [candidate division WOR-3 bacterium]
MKHLLNTAVRAAHAGGRVLMQGFRTLRLSDAETKGPDDIVTEWDRASEAEIVRVISEAFPDSHFLAEEKGEFGKGEMVWIIDPLDGTKNYYRGLPVFAVSVALAIDGEIRLGVVHDPTRNETYTALKGQGAFCDTRRLCVSEKKELLGSFLATGFPHRRKQDMDLYLATFKRLFRDALSVRRLGAAALDLAHVASGIYDGFWEFQLYPWDVAAGYLLVKEAGGLMTDFDGREEFLSSSSVLAANPWIHEQMLEAIREVLG